MLDDELDLRRARERAKQGLDKFAQKLKKSFGGGTPSKADLKKLEEAKLKHKEYIKSLNAPRQRSSLSKAQEKAKEKARGHAKSIAAKGKLASIAKRQNAKDKDLARQRANVKAGRIVTPRPKPNTTPKKKKDEYHVGGIKIW